MWSVQNGPQLNADKSEVVLLGTPAQLWSATNITTVDVAGSTLPVASKLESLGVTIDSNLRFDCHARNVAKACNFHTSTRAQSTDWRCCPDSRVQHRRLQAGLLQCAVEWRTGGDFWQTTVHPEQPGQSQGRTDARPLLHSLHWILVRQRVTYELAVLTHKVRTTATPMYLCILVTWSSPPSHKIWCRYLYPVGVIDIIININ